MLPAFTAQISLKLNPCSRFGRPEQIFIVPNGIHTEKYTNPHKRGAFRTKFGIPDQAITLLSLGRLHHVKNPDLLIEVLAIINRPDVHLVFAGPDEENIEAKLRLLAQNHRCADRVHFTGLLAGEDVLQVLADADLLVMPSAVESFGMAAVEAMAAGVPILVSENVPVGRWAEQAGAGRAAACNPTEFARAAIEMLDDRQALEIMGRRGKELARQRFEINTVAEQMLRQYQSIVTTGSPLPQKEAI